MKQMQGGTAAGAKPGQAISRSRTERRKTTRKEGRRGREDKDKKEEGGDSVKRPDKPPRTPDPREFEVALDKNGKVPPFNFIGQALAGCHAVAGQSFEMQPRLAGVAATAT